MGSEEEVQTILISDEEGKLDAPLVIEEELPEEEEVNPLELDLPLAEIVSSESEA